MSEVRRERILLFVIGEGFRCLLSALLQRGKVAFQVYDLPLFFINPLLLRFEFRLTSMRFGVVRVGINRVLVQRKRAPLQVQIYFFSGDSCLRHVDFNIFLRFFTVRNWRLRRRDRCRVSGFRSGDGARAGSCCLKRGSAARIEALLTGPEVLPVQVIVANHSGTPHEVLLLFAVTPGSVRNGLILLRYILCLSINATRNHRANHQQSYVEMKAPTVDHSRLSVAATVTTLHCRRAFPMCTARWNIWSNLVFSLLLKLAEQLGLMRALRSLMFQCFGPARLVNALRSLPVDQIHQLPGILV